MKNLLCCTICLLTGFCALMARNLSGRIITADSGEPLAFANVVTLSVADSSLIAGSVSDEDGLFKIPLHDDEKKEMFLRVSYIGYGVTDTPVTSDAMGDIVMTPSSTELGEVIVSERKPSTKLTGTGLLTNVANTELSSIGTAKDLLRFIPLLVNVGDSWTVLTKGTPVFYINGREMRDKSELEAIRSMDIVNVEVITNPGAQYPPGTTAVVRIKTRRPQGEGLSGMIDPNIGYSEKRLIIANANLNYRHGKLDIFARGHYQDIPNRQTVDAHTVLNTHPEVEFKSNSTTRMRNSGAYVRTGASYTVNENSSFGASYYFFGYPKTNSRSSGWLESTVGGKKEEITLNDQYTKNGLSPYHSVNAYYIGSIGKTTINFNADYYSNTDDTDQTIKETPQHGDANEVLSTSHTSRDMVMAKLVMDNKLWGGRLEYGAHYYFSSHRSSYTENGNSTAYYHTQLREQSISPFIEYTRDFPFGRIVAGLRYEHLDQNYYEGNIKNNNLSHTYNDLYPSLSWARQFGQVQLQLNYRLFSSRPGYSTYSNEVKYINRYRREAGNPNIKRAKYQSVDLMGMWRFLILSAWYENSKDPFTRQSYIDPEDPAVEIMTTVNLRHNIQNAGVAITAQPQFGCYQPRLSLSFNKPRYIIETAGKSMSFNKPTFGVFLFNTLTLPKDWMIILQLIYNTKGDQRSSKLLRDNFNVTGVVYKWFFNRTVKLSLIANDIFHTSKYGVVNYMGGSTTTNWVTSDSRSVWFGISYTFNGTQSKYRGNSTAKDTAN